MIYHTLIRHQELVALLGTRNLYLRLVYAHIANYTQVKGAWCGTQRDLAAQLELPIATVSNQLTELIQKGLIVREANKYRSLGVLPNSANEHACSRDEQLCSANEQIRSVGEQNPAPINYINKSMKRNNNIARDTIATHDPSNNFSFDRLLAIYRKRAGNYKIADETIDQCRAIWANYPLWKRMLLFEELSNQNGWIKPRFDWTLSDFDPQPDFLTGVQQDEYWKTDDWTLKHEPLVMVKTSDNLFKVCTNRTAYRFGLSKIRDVKAPTD